MLSLFKTPSSVTLLSTPCFVFLFFFCQTFTFFSNFRRTIIVSTQKRCCLVFFFFLFFISLEETSFSLFSSLSRFSFLWPPRIFISQVTATRRKFTPPTLRQADNFITFRRQPAIISSSFARPFNSSTFAAALINSLLIIVAISRLRKQFTRRPVTLISIRIHGRSSFLWKSSLQLRF